MALSGRSAMSGGAGERWPTPRGDPTGFQPPTPVPTPPPVGPPRPAHDGDTSTRIRDILLIVTAVAVNLALVVAIVLVVNRGGDDDGATATGEGAGEGQGGEATGDEDGGGGEGRTEVDPADGTTTDDEPDGPPVAPADLSLDDLEPVLITADEIAGNYRQYGDAADDQAEQQDAFRESADLSAACLEAYDHFREAEEQDRGRWVHYFRNQPRHFVSQGVFLVEEGDPTVPEWAEAYTSECSDVSYRDDDWGRVRTSSTTEPLDGIGDEAVVLIETTSVTRPVEYSYDWYAVIVARGGVVTYTTMADAVDDEYEITPADRGLVRTLAETSDARLLDLLED